MKRYIRSTNASNVSAPSSYESGDFLKQYPADIDDISERLFEVICDWFDSDSAKRTCRPYIEYTGSDGYGYKFSIESDCPFCISAWRYNTGEHQLEHEINVILAEYGFARFYIDVHTTFIENDPRPYKQFDAIYFVR